MLHDLEQDLQKERVLQSLHRITPDSLHNIRAIGSLIQAHSRVLCLRRCSRRTGRLLSQQPYTVRITEKKKSQVDHHEHSDGKLSPQ